MTKELKHSLNRREFMKISATATLSLALGACTLSADSKPNVLFIIVDDLRPQLGCYGNSLMITPNIDRFSETSIQFNSAYCQVPVCGASRASLLTGLNPTRDRFINYHSRADEDIPEIETLPEYFKKMGYETRSLGKIFHEQDDSLESWSREPWRPKGLWRDYKDPENQQIAENDKRHAGPPFECLDIPDNEYFDGKIADKAINDLEKLRESSTPFFMALGFRKPHLPFNAPKKYWDMYPEESISLADNPFVPYNAPEIAIHNWGELRQYYGIPKKGALSEDMAKKLIRGYYACTSYTDTQIGKVLNSLSENKLDKNTIIVLIGDHGWNLGEHTLWCKHSHFETSLKSPMFIKVPGVNSRQIDEIVSFTDIYPTLCEFANINKPTHLQGKSLKLLMKKGDVSWQNEAYSRFKKGDTIKTPEFRYTEFRDNNKGLISAKMLYDHRVDPDENNNVAGKSEYLAIEKELSTRLQRYFTD